MKIPPETKLSPNYIMYLQKSPLYPFKSCPTFEKKSIKKNKRVHYLNKKKIDERQTKYVIPPRFLFDDSSGLSFCIMNP